MPFKKRVDDVLSKRWKQSYANTNKFLKKHEEWLNGEVSVSYLNKKIQQIPSTSRGRPEKTFEESSDRTKFRRVVHLLEGSSTEELTHATRLSLRRTGRRSSTEELTHATRLSLRRTGRRDVAYLLKEATTNPKRATKIKKIYHAKPKEAKPYTPEEALNLQVQDRHSICVSDTSAEVKLQALLNHTIGRIANMQKDIIHNEIENILPDSFQFFVKFECDGSSGQSQYKQSFTSATHNAGDSKVFISSIVPLQLYAKTLHNQEKIILWQNPRPGSTRFCRPIRFQFISESADVI
ncbi:hypothetical protein QE152_g21639 [Popillia japonica]|uniref:Uncharacterized protein n=1 Tax=Popillia japonica TaxID=7064 RepID=A0AAW1KPP9_POPJA